jgi:hypothetical protein
LRCGKQVKLIVRTVEAEQQRVDTELITLLADARRWFEELKSGKRHSIAMSPGQKNVNHPILAEVSVSHSWRPISST